MEAWSLDEKETRTEVLVVEREGGRRPRMKDEDGRTARRGALFSRQLAPWTVDLVSRPNQPPSKSASDSARHKRESICYLQIETGRFSFPSFFSSPSFSSLSFFSSCFSSP